VVIAVVATDPAAEDAWNKLVKDGCAPLFLACHFTRCAFQPGYLRKTLSEFRTLAQRYAEYAPKLAAQIRKVAKEIRRAQSWGYRPLHTLDIPLDRLLDDEADGLIDVMGPRMRAASRHLLSDDFALLQLCTYVQRLTGRRHYPEIAAVLTAVNGSMGKEETYQPDTISKKIRRWKPKLGEDATKVIYANMELRPNKERASLERKLVEDTLASVKAVYANTKLKPDKKKAT